ncbi:MAG TPA: ferredoxin reductase [Pseudoxanthomonas sp.]|nr:ferredoxin reductase [Pseudoxanthomonas sp.]
MNARLDFPPKPDTSRVRRLLKPVVAPSVFDFWASRLNPSWSWERPLARVVAREQASRDAVTLVLKPNRHWSGFQPGQHLNLSAEINGSRVTRSYSLTGPPRADGCVAITVKGIEGGKLSQYLCRETRIGDVLELGAAFGDMTLPERLDGRWLFLAAGSGITPLMAMVRTLAAQAMPVPLDLVYWARNREELCFAAELRALAATHANFKVHFALTREAELIEGESSGRIDRELIDSLIGDASERHVFACGPGGFVDSARSLFSTSAPTFHAEAFTPPMRVAEDSGSVQVILAASGRTLTLARGESLLTALEAEGLRPASGCRMGICNTCACGKSSGTTRNLNTGDLAGEPVSALKLCISSAVSDLVLDL